MEPMELLELCVKIAADSKAMNMISMDLNKLSVVCDYFLIVSASNKRHCQAIAEKLREELKKAGSAPLRIEGYSEGGWILLDCGSVVVHVFQDEERRYYNLERLWGDAEIKEYS